MNAMSSNAPMSLDLPVRNVLSSGLPSPQTPSASRGTNPLAAKVTSVLSTSYSDTEFRDALSLVDERGIHNDARTRRHIRLDLQKEVIDSNAEIIAEFGCVAEVGPARKTQTMPHSNVIDSNSTASGQPSRSSTSGTGK